MTHVRHPPWGVSTGPRGRRGGAVLQCPDSDGQRRGAERGAAGGEPALRGERRGEGERAWVGCWDGGLFDDFWGYVKK